MQKQLSPSGTSPDAVKALRPRVAVARMGDVVLKAGRGEPVTRHLHEKLSKAWKMERHGWKRGRDWGKGDEDHSAVTSENGGQYCWVASKSCSAFIYDIC